jgi:AraC-like DNA-binding protein
MYDRLDTTYAATDSSTFTFDIISTSLAPRYEANRRAGHVAEALELADKTFAAIDSALAWQKQNDAAELAIIYQTHERELALEESQAKITIYRILAFSFFAIMIVIFVALWRLAIAHRREVIKNRELYDLIQHEQLREVREIQRLVRQPEQERTPGEQLFLRLVELMAKEQPYTNAELNRDTLAAMLATNHRYIDEAIRECSDALSTNAFINGYRVDHAARLLTQTDEPIALIAEMSGFANRTTFNEQFRSRYKMTPSEFRTAAKT